jgi:hypothetical protein
VIHDVDRLLAGAGGGTNFERGDAFSDVALEDIKNMDAGERALWQKLLNHAISASSSKPSGKWLKAADALIDAIGRERFVQRLSVWLPLIGKPGPGRIVNGFEGPMNEPTMLAEHNVDILKGLLWSVSTIHDPAHLPAMAALLGDVAEACFKKIALIGARCPRVANAALVALSLMPGPEPVAQLTRIQSKSKKPSAKKLVESAMKSAAAHQQVTPEELAEMSVPDFGFNPEGVRTMTLGDWTAEIVITGTQDVELRWRKNGATKTQASIPADVKRDHADALNQLKRTLKDINQVLPSQAIRIENLLLEQRDWPLDVWRKRYLEHPLISHIARRLIWQIEGPTPTLFIPHNGVVLERPQRSDHRTTRFPHPPLAPYHLFRSNRRRLAEVPRGQPDHPALQAGHREIYVLTDAERTTGIYSNRFAAHILRQHQFHALCGTRGWSVRADGPVRFVHHPHPQAARPDLRVEFWVNPGGTEVSGSGIFLHVSTDQVRFAPLEADVPIPPHRDPADPLLGADARCRSVRRRLLDRQQPQLD